MSLSVKFSRNWEYWEDPAGNNVRHIPTGLVIELADDVAAAAIYDGAALPTSGKVTPDVQRHLDAYAAMVQELEEGVALDQAMQNMATMLAQHGVAGIETEPGGEGDPNIYGDADDPDAERTVDPVEEAAPAARKSKKR